MAGAATGSLLFVGHAYLRISSRAHTADRKLAVVVHLFWLCLRRSFSFLERSSAVIRAKLVACLGLYLILGMFYYAIFNLIQEIHPGSFIEGPTPIQASRHSLLYLSLATLTTMGYGDVVPVWRPARMIAALEAVTGVFYVAITVARLVAAYQVTDREKV